MANRFPDFIIGGAPKCGTTSLHFILNQHPAIGLPDEEIHYFDADDPVTHPDFFFHKDGELIHYDNRAENGELLSHYAACFAPFADLPLVGEDSTTYLFSEVAPVRIRDRLPEVRLVFMLRNPVARAYSQYWHMVKSGRTICTFEQAIHTHLAIILGSTYLPHLKRYYDIFGSDRVKVVLFEDFIANNQAAIDGVTDFLGTSRMEVRDEASWFNKTYYPTSLTGQLALNRVGRKVVAWRYGNHLGSRRGPGVGLRQKLHHLWFTRVNKILLKAERPPPMRESTRDYLSDHLSRRNDGLSELLGRDLAALWPGFDG
ncbi:sulfotransferase family protein [Ruegeria jejuensis]|uniref:sulfotransferase family protein n=1 Tax=Ruegeria jejuensis TaxID=3233338 RepID=UPI00355C54C1